MAQTAVQDYYSVTIENLRAYLQVNGTKHDFVIQLCFDAAKAEADGICNNPFTAAAGSGSGSGDAVTIPADVQLCVLQLMARDFHRRANGLASEQETNVGSVSWTQRELDTLFRYRLNPGL